MTSTTDLLDLAGGGVRGESYEFELLDAAHNIIGTLDASETAAASVRVDTSRPIARTLNGLTIVSTDLSGINVLTDRVRPVMILANGDRLSLGVFVFGDDNRVPASWGTTWTPDLFDETFNVDIPLQTAVGLPPGGSVLQLAAALLRQVPNLIWDLSAATDAQATSVAAAHKPPDSMLLPLTDLATLVGCYPPHVTNEGVLIFRPVTSSSATADHVYDDGGRVIADSVRTTNSSYRAPNLYQVVSESPTGSIVGEFRLPPEAPNSIEATGNVRISSRSQAGLTLDLANLAARIDALTDRKSYVKASFSSPNDPRHQPFDLVELYGVRFQEISYGWTLVAGGIMDHGLQGFY